MRYFILFLIPDTVFDNPIKSVAQTDLSLELHHSPLSVQTANRDVSLY